MHRKRILVAEDDANTLKLMTYLLTREGYMVDTASDGKEAWEKVNEKSPDLVIIDGTLRNGTLRNGDGYAICLELKGANGDGKRSNGRKNNEKKIVGDNGQEKEISVILISASDPTYYPSRRISKAISKADDFISKPFDPARLTKSVERLLK